MIGDYGVEVKSQRRMAVREWCVSVRERSRSGEGGGNIVFTSIHFLPSLPDSDVRVYVRGCKHTI